MAEIDKTLLCKLQVEEWVAKEARQGKDAATLEVVMEAAEPLTHSQLEGFGMLSKQVFAPP